MHLQGAAFDISMANHDPESFEAAARAIGFTGFGFYPRQNFMHVDIGRARQWGDPFPPHAGRFAPEPPRLRESLTESRTMQGGGAAGVATIGAAGVEVVQQAVADTQSALQPLIPYLDTLRWAFIAMALIGVGVTIYARWDDWRKGRR
jgi:zinc D-Ala-D-Ala carboxypeptidase